MINFFSHIWASKAKILILFLSPNFVLIFFIPGKKKVPMILLLLGVRLSYIKNENKTNITPNIKI